MTYEPKPIDTSSVVLSDEILNLIERLSKHNHDVWARGRIADGWQFGTERNDRRKEHPCLVPYEELPDSEKQYDRETAREVLQAVLAMGYVIAKP